MCSRMLASRNSSAGVHYEAFPGSHHHAMLPRSPLAKQGWSAHLTFTGKCCADVCWQLPYWRMCFWGKGGSGRRGRAGRCFAWHLFDGNLLPWQPRGQAAVRPDIDGCGSQAQEVGELLGGYGTQAGHRDSRLASCQDAEEQTIRPEGIFTLIPLPPACNQSVGFSGHYEIWKYCQSTSKVHAQVLQNLRVQGKGPAGACRAEACCADRLLLCGHVGRRLVPCRYC